MCVLEEQCKTAGEIKSTGPCVLGRNSPHGDGIYLVDLTRLDDDDRRILAVVLAHQTARSVADVMESFDAAKTIALVAAGHTEGQDDGAR